jgi:hypothetical protein
MADERLRISAGEKNQVEILISMENYTFAVDRARFDFDFQRLNLPAE